MDLVCWDQEVFKKIQSEYEGFLASIGFCAQAYIPAAAYSGDNIAVKSKQMLWYTGKTVLEQMETSKTNENAEKSLRIPVQDLYRFGNRRMLAERIESGSVVLGEKIIL